MACSTASAAAPASRTSTTAKRGKHKTTSYIEQNGFLTEAGREDELTAACLRPLLASHDVVLSGVNVHHLAAIQAAAGSVRTVRSQASPFVDLAALRRSGADYLSKRSANTRQQLRRSDRFYQGRGPITLSPAASLSMAHDRLDRLADMHQATWQARGQPGSFGRPFFARFHHALIEAGYPGRNLTLLEVSAGAEAIGILYNFIWKGRMSAYQSGFVYPGETAAKPGLTCHRQAIEHALSQGHDIYDFLAGEDRYKRSLADQSHQQLWLEAGPRWSPRQLSHSLVQWLRCRKSRIAATARSS